MQVTVVGAGVIGLCTALVLEEHGHDVRVVAADRDDTTSTVAGALWFPYRAGPPERVQEWAHVTRLWLEHLCADPAAGVDMLVGYEIDDDDATDRPSWAHGVAVTRAPAPVTGAPMAWRYTAPRAEPAVFLPYLASKLRAPIERRRVVDLGREPGDVVVNCTGLAARELVGDDELVPLFGQVVVTEVGDVDRTVTITDERDPDAMFYVIPRRDELVLGGCAIPRARADVDPDLTARILARARAFGLRHGPVTAVRAALRPYRPVVRLERSGRIVHDYGHGGAGFTLCRGCAEDVARLVASGATDVPG